jgi:hypothetical protein
VGKTPGTYTARIDARGELTSTDALIQAVDLPLDMSAPAWEARRALYDVPGLERLGGPGTPLREGMVPEAGATPKSAKRGLLGIAGL